MRFCMATTFYPPYNLGGCGTYVRALSRALVAQGHDVEVMHCLDAYRLKFTDPMPDEGPDEGVVVHRLQSPFGFLSPLITQLTGRPGIKSRATRGIFARSFDVVHFHNISLLGGPALITQSQAPVNLYTLHDQWLHCPTHVLWKNNSKPCDRATCFSCSLVSRIPPQLWRYTGLVKRSIDRVDTILAPSEHVARLHRNMGLKPPIHVLPSFSAIEPQSDHAPPRHDRPRFLFVGRLTVSKGIVQLLEEFAGLPAYDLQIVGDGELRSKLERRFACCSNISFLGPKPQAELLSIYKNAAALILPSLVPETFALSIVEAFACSTPAIVRDVGGAGESIEATGGGLIYRTSEELRETLARVACEPGLREALAARARDGFLRLYTSGRHVKNYLALVDSIRHAKGLV
jgi:glycosyltransferase involved in cell wall biosynthesis